MFKAVIAGYSRSPFTMARKGELIDIKPVNMLAEVIKSLTTKSKINKQDIEDIVIGCAFQVGEQYRRQATPREYRIRCCFQI